MKVEIDPKFWSVFAVMLLLGGCFTPAEQVVVKPGQSYVGQNLDKLVARLGAPQGSFKMDSGRTLYVWLASSVRDVSSNLGGATGGQKSCKISAIVNSNGFITEVQTEDSNTESGQTTLSDDSKNVCAQKLDNSTH